MLNSTWPPLALLALACGAAHGADNDADKIVNISGFGTLGAVYNSTDQADFVRSSVQGKGAGATRRLAFGVDSAFGLQLDVAPAAAVKGVLQVLTARRPDGTFGPQLTWAFAKYAPSDDLALRVGRVGFDVFMQADSRNVGYSFQWVRPPVDFFGGLFVNYLDGADLVLKRGMGGGVGSVKLFAGKAREKSPLDADNYNDLDGSAIRGAYAEYQNRKWLYRLGYTQLRYSHELPFLGPLVGGMRSAGDQLHGLGMDAAAASAYAYASDVSTVGKKVRYLNAGAVYEDGPLQVQTMFSHISYSTPAYPASIAGFISASYRLGNWKPYLSYSAVTPASAEHGTGLPAGVGLEPLIDAAHQLHLMTVVKQHTVSLGARYDFMPNADLKLQVDRIATRHPQFWRNVQPGWNGHATVVSLALDFVF
jgi:hypothetical protein